MNRATIVMVAVALAAAGGAWSMRPQELAQVQYEDTGQALFPDFADPTVATALEVVGYDEESAKVVRFAVEQKEGRWVIPSHNDYPADGTERMGKAAASFIDVKKDLYYGDKENEHAAFGLLDPENTEGKPEEKGQRITIKDASGTKLVDIIVGKAIEGKDGMYYVRYPDEKRVYGARLSLDISTNFSDWIEKDLLHVERDEIVRLEYDPYSVDEQQGKVTGTDPVVTRFDPEADGGKGAWIPIEQTKVPAGKVADNMKFRQMATAIANIKIVGVRPRPEMLTLGELQSKGFFVAQGGPQPRLFGNEGQIAAVTKDGLVYTLYFGEVTYESGLALTAGVTNESGDEADDEAGDDPSGDEADDEAPDDEGAAEGEAARKASRFMWVDVAYDPALDQTAGQASDAEGDEAPDVAPGEDGETAESDATAEPAEPSVDADKVQAGQERAQKLRERFGKWYYVISDTSFTQIHKERDELWKDAPAQE